MSEFRSCGNSIVDARLILDHERSISSGNFCSMVHFIESLLVQGCLQHNIHRCASNVQYLGGHLEGSLQIAKGSLEIAKSLIEHWVKTLY